MLSSTYGKPASASDFLARLNVEGCTQQSCLSLENRAKKRSASSRMRQSVAFRSISSIPEYHIRRLRRHRQNRYPHHLGRSSARTISKRFHIFSHRVSLCIRKAFNGPSLALLWHTLLWRHGVCARLGDSLLLQVGLILQGLLLICRHVLLWVGGATHGLLDAGWHGGDRLLLFWGIERRLAIRTVGVGRLWSIQTSLIMS
jgi:hypothetical protein